MRVDSRTWVVCSLTAISLGALPGCSLLPQEQQPLAPPLVKPAPVHYATAKVRRGTIINAISGSAEFVSTRKFALSYKSPIGRIAEVDIRPGQAVHRGQVLMRLDTSDNEYQFAQAKIQLQKDQLQVQELRKQGADPYQIQMAQLTVKSDELTVQHLQEEIQLAALTSPIDGVVTDVSNHKIGDHVDPYEPLITVVDTRQLALAYSMDDAQTAGEVTVGMPVDILYHGQHIRGKVVQVKQNDATYATDILIEPDVLPPGVKIGDSADFQIVLQKKENVLIVPKGAVRTLFGDTYVHVLSGNTVEQVTVQTGVQDATDVEIVKGLQNGQTVILQ